MDNNVHHQLEQPPTLKILQTCKELRDQGRDFFYKKNTLEAVFDVTGLDRVSTHNMADESTHFTHVLTDVMLLALHLPSIRHFHIVVVMGAMNMNARIGIDWSVISRMVNLEKLDVALAFEGDQETAEGHAPECLRAQRAWWKKSMCLEMMVIRILKYVPLHVGLQWKIWDTLAIDLNSGWKRWRNAIGQNRVKEIARAYQIVRGRKAGILVSEGQCCSA